MVKMENANFACPDLPPGFESLASQIRNATATAAVESSRNPNPNLIDCPSLPPGFDSLPPGFESLLPQIHTAAAAESSRNQNPTPEENEPQSHDSSTEQEPRRTHRKRARPEFYHPPNIQRMAAPELQPEAPSRRRGRPQKAQLLSLFPLQEAQRRDDNAVERADNAGCQTTTEDIETIISRHLENARQIINGSEGSEEYINLVCTLRAIVKKCGDITKNSSLECDKMKALMFIGICNVVQGLQNKRLVDLDINSLDSDYRTVRDARNMKVDVQWLHQRLDEIKEAVLLSGKIKGMENEKNKRVAVIEGKRGELLLRRQELERIKSEVEAMEEHIAREVIMVDELDKEYSHHMSRISELQHLHSIDKLI